MAMTIFEAIWVSEWSQRIAESQFDHKMADDEQLSSSEEIAQQLSAMNNQWYNELYAGINREKILKQKVVELEQVVTNKSM